MTTNNPTDTASNPPTDTDKQLIEAMLTRRNISWTIPRVEKGSHKISVGHGDQGAYKGPSDNTVDFIFDETGTLTNLWIGDIWEQ